MSILLKDKFYTDSPKFRLNQVLATVVIYNKKLDDSETLNSIEKSMPLNERLDVFIYDNSPVKQSLETTKFKKFNFNYFHDSDNSGISVAYNKGAKLAKEMGKSWLLFLDQDTTFGVDFIDRIYTGVYQYPNVNLFAPILKLSSNVILSPYKFKYFHGKHLGRITPGIQNLQNCQPINSGILITLKSFENAGGYNENVKLDFSDHQFIERFKINNNYFVAVNSIGIQDFSGEESDFKKIQARFRYYCIGALNFKTNRFKNYFFLYFFLILKIFKKSIKHKSLVFIGIFIEELKNNKSFKK